MNFRFIFCGLLLAGVVGLQTVWLIVPVHEGPVGRVAFAVLVVLHLPAVALEWYIGAGKGAVLLMITVDCLLWGFGIAWVIGWLRRMLSPVGGR